MKDHMKSIDDTDTDFFLALITKHFYVDVTNINAKNIVYHTS